MIKRSSLRGNGPEGTEDRDKYEKNGEIGKEDSKKKTEKKDKERKFITSKESKLEKRISKVRDR